MSLLVLSDVSKSFGAVDLFRGVSFSLERGARLALVGPNGVGKTTLLRIILGEELPSDGRVTRSKKAKIGYLPQEVSFISEETLWETCLAVFDDLRRQEAALARLEAEMTDSPNSESLFERYGTLQEKFERAGGYAYETRIRQTLTGLGFSERDYEMPLSRLSGGQRTRAYLARVLLESPDVLLLDEPTNHLDIAAVEWLEGALSQWEGAALIVSHDRYFLDKVASGVLEMSADGVERYRGNYSAYLQQRRERWARREEVFAAEKERMLREAAYIRKNIAGQNVSQARGRLRRLSRLVQAMEQLGVDAVMGEKWSRVSAKVSISVSDLSPGEVERRIRALRLPERTPPPLSLHLHSRARSGELVLRTKNLLVGYAGRPLFRAPDIELHRLECAALIGPNGAGKTTFLKTIFGELPPLEGETHLGASLRIGYFEQAHEGLDPKKTLVEEIQSAAPAMLEGEARAYLARYLFRGDDAYKRVESLSGGERGRLALAKLALQETNFLLLDEPTNHLDIPSQEVLQSALDSYEGTILLVSHDRYLIDALATQIWEISPSEASLRVFKGTYSEMRAARENSAARSADAAAAKQKSARRPRRDPAQKEARRRLAKLQEVENEIAALEARLAELGARLASPPSNPEVVRRLGEEYAALQREMDEKLDIWESLAE
jgi:ATP-binding cassette subfamily F protein 3